MTYKGIPHQKISRLLDVYKQGLLYFAYKRASIGSRWTSMHNHMHEAGRCKLKRQASL